MQPIKNKLIFGCLLFLIFLFVFFANRKVDMEKMHVLKSPMLISSDANGEYYILPKGTYLYLDGVFHEGFKRYKVYVNVRDDLPLLDNKTGVEAPLSAGFINKSELINLLKSVKLDSDDVKSILANGKFNDLDKQEIMRLLKTQ